MKKKILTLAIILATAVSFSGCFGSQPDYSSTMSSDIGIEGAKVTHGKDGYKIETTRNVFTGDFVFVNTKEDSKIDESSIVDTTYPEKGIKIHHLSDGSMIVYFPSAKVEGKITRKVKK